MFFLTFLSDESSPNPTTRQINQIQARPRQLSYWTLCTHISGWNLVAKSPTLPPRRVPQLRLAYITSNKVCVARLCRIPATLRSEGRERGGHADWNFLIRLNYSNRLVSLARRKVSPTVQLLFAIFGDAGTLRMVLKGGEPLETLGEALF